MATRGVLGALLAGLTLGVLTGAPAVAAGLLVVNATAATAVRADGTVTVTVSLTNVGNEPVSLGSSLTVVGAECEPRIAAGGDSVPPQQQFDVKVTFGRDCFLDPALKTVTVDLDGPGPLTAVTVAAPAARGNWWVLLPGLVIGVVMAVVVGGIGYGALRRVVSSFAGRQPDRQRIFDRRTALVDERIAAVTGIHLNEQSIPSRFESVDEVPLRPASVRNVVQLPPDHFLVTSKAFVEVASDEGSLAPPAAGRAWYRPTGTELARTSAGSTLLSPGKPRAVREGAVLFLSGGHYIVDPATSFPVFAEPIHRWKPLEPLSYRFGSQVKNLSADWSIKDSWVSNVTVLTTAVVAIATSTDALTSLLGEAPKAALGVMTVAGLLSAAVVALATTLLKIIGPSSSKVSVLGLLLSTSLVALAAGLQVFTIGASLLLLVSPASTQVSGRPNLGKALAQATGLPAVVVLVTFAVGVVLTAYLARALSEQLENGVDESLPTIPDDALEVWAADEDWQRGIVVQRIADRYSPFLLPGGLGDVLIGYPLVSGTPDNSPGDSWAPPVTKSAMP